MKKSSLHLDGSPEEFPSDLYPIEALPFESLSAFSIPEEFKVKSNNTLYQYRKEAELLTEQNYNTAKNSIHCRTVSSRDKINAILTPFRISGTKEKKTKHLIFDSPDELARAKVVLQNFIKQYQHISLLRENIPVVCPSPSLAETESTAKKTPVLGYYTSFISKSSPHTVRLYYNALKVASFADNTISCPNPDKLNKIRAFIKHYPCVIATNGAKNSLTITTEGFFDPVDYIQQEIKNFIESYLKRKTNSTLWTEKIETEKIEGAPPAKRTRGIVNL